MAAISYKTIGSIGATVNINIENAASEYLLVADASPVVLAANVVVNFTGTPSEGTAIDIMWGGDFDLNGNTFTINGVSLSDLQAINKGVLSFLYIYGSWSFSYSTDLSKAGVLSGAVLADGTVALSALEEMNAGYVLVGNTSKVPTPTAISGDATLSSSGVLTIANSAITNAKISTSAAIARTKLASGTASYVLVNDGSGVMSESQYLGKAQGGFGTNVAAATGFVRFASGTLNIGSINESKNFIVSFDTDDVGADNTYTIGSACSLTPTNCSGFVIKDIAGTDDAVITLLKNGVAISSGTITFAASSAQNSAGVFGAFAATTFVAGDTLSLQATKPTPGGKVNITLQFTRTA